MTALVDMYPRVLRVIELLAEGYTLTKACRYVEITTVTFNRYVGSSPELAELRDEAVQNGSDTLADILLEIDTNPVYGSSDPAKMKVLSDNIKWLLSRRRPTQYGDKVTVDVNVTADAAIVEALALGRDRATRLRQDNVQEVEYVELDRAFDPNEFT